MTENQKDEVTQDELRKLFFYDPENGQFIRRVTRRTARAGTVAGTVWTGRDGRKYRQIFINGRVYLEHRLAWLYIFGKWPRHFIDHIDTDGLNNRLCNLREATHAENKRNTKAPASNTSGFKGVTWHRQRSKWQAKIKVNGRTKHLGLFETPEAAHAAYSKAAKSHYGQFARAE